MKNILTFITPVLHPENAESWPEVKRTLAQTVRSISRQDRDGWKAIIVANHGVELPDLPAGVDVKWVDFPPNKYSVQDGVDLETYRNSTRMDKGNRILAGLRHGGEMGHVMIVDHDDFVSRRLTSFVAANPGANGWFLQHGYVWTDGGKLLYRHRDFSHLCGTSHIIRSDLFLSPERMAHPDYVRGFLGSHIFRDIDLAAAGNQLEPLPFIGAVYRTGHIGTRSGSKGVVRSYLLRKNLLKRPLELINRALSLRIKNPATEYEYFGASIT